MSTRAEQFHAEEQRRGPKNHPRTPGRTKPGTEPKDRSPAKKHAGRKATVALEQTAPGKPRTRKSTRKSANRAKSDTTLNLVEEIRKASPESRFRKSAARASRVRGKQTGGR